LTIAPFEVEMRDWLCLKKQAKGQEELMSKAIKESPRFRRAAAVAPHHLAAQAGQAVLEAGGNAVEAMVAMGSTIAVVYPHMTGIGGDGFWLIREPNGKIHALDASGYAGSGATAAAYRALGFDSVPLRGTYSALTVPGAVGGWNSALELSKAIGGKMPLKDILGFAANHARNGVPTSRGEARYVVKDAEDVYAAPHFASHYMRDKERYKEAEVRTFPALAQTLDHLAHAGLDDYYRGDVGREIAADFAELNGFVSREDLARFATHWRKPLEARLNGVTLYNHPPSSQGFAQLLTLGIYNQLNIRDYESFEGVHGLIESIKRAWRIRDAVVTDFDHLSHDPQSFLNDERFAREAHAIKLDRAAPVPLPPFGEGDTVWMGAIDGQGCAVSYIQSLFWEYGSGCVLPKTGILLQNRGTSFSLDPKAKNPLTPGRRPFHTLNPPMAIFDDGRVMSYGTMGGDPQPQITAQTFIRAGLHGVPVSEAIDRPRFIFGRAYKADRATLKLEKRFDSGLADRLEKAGHEIEWFDADYANPVGHSGMLIRDPRSGEIEADHDPRADGGAHGC
jgi:gamma-glutamyltranspeptidase